HGASETNDVQILQRCYLAGGRHRYLRIQSRTGSSNAGELMAPGATVKVEARPQPFFGVGDGAEYRGDLGECVLTGIKELALFQCQSLDCSAGAGGSYANTPCGLGKRGGSER